MKKCNKCAHCEVCKWYFDEIEDCEYFEDENHWIDVDIKLPLEHDVYLVTLKTPKKYVVVDCECEMTFDFDYDKSRFNVNWLFDDFIKSNYPDAKVIAWQPKPDAYKGGKAK